VSKDEGPRDRAPKRGPIAVADDDDDDDTVVDVGGASLADMVGLGASDETDTELDVPALERASGSKRPLPPPLRTPPIEARNHRGPSLPHLSGIVDDDDDDETFVLPRKEQAPVRSTRPLPQELSDDGMLPSEEQTARLPAPRRLDAIQKIGADEADDRTLSRPVVRRATFIPSGEGSPARLLDELGLSTRPQPVARDAEEHVVIARSPRPLPGPNVGDGPSIVEAKPKEAASTDEGDDDMGAFLVIDAPSGATVFVDGIERGTGRTIVNGIDPHGRFAIRVHKAGFKPWSGTTTLNGMREAIVRPTLKKKDE